MSVLKGDLLFMAAATSYLNIVIMPHEIVLFSAENLVAAFYLLSLPDTWHPFFTFERKVDGASLGGPPGVEVYVSAAVLPIGFSAATATMQHWHRSCALGKLPQSIQSHEPGLFVTEKLRTDVPVPFSTEDGHRGCWSIYLDVFSDMLIWAEPEAEEMIGEVLSWQATLRRHYVASNVPRGEEKAVQSQPVNAHSGYHMEGRAAAIRISGLRSLEACSIAFFLLDQWMVALPHLQILAGRWPTCGSCAGQCGVGLMPFGTVLPSQERFAFPADSLVLRGRDCLAFWPLSLHALPH